MTNDLHDEIIDRLELAIELIDEKMSHWRYKDVEMYEMWKWELSETNRIIIKVLEVNK